MMYTIQEYILLFFIVSIAGWCMEVFLKLAEDHKFVNRGFLIGPYCPIYGKGTLLITIFLSKYRNDIVVLFVMSTLICSVLEYIASYVMEKMFNARWWDYSHYKYNLNGRICLINSLLFGLGGTILVLFIVPFLTSLISLMSLNVRTIIMYTLIVVYIIDNIVSFSVVIKFRGLNNKFNDKDNTEEITKMIKKSLQNSIFIRRIKSAYPIMRDRFDNLVDELNKRLNKFSSRIDEIDLKLKDKQQKYINKNKKDE